MTGKRFDSIRADFRAWVKRPPVRSATTARARVLANIEESSGRWRRRPATASALAVAGLTIAVLLVVISVRSGGPWSDRLGRKPAEPMVSAVSERAPRPLLVYELGSGTKLYLALAEHARTVAADGHERQKGDQP